jgi:hypothetical protein
VVVLVKKYGYRVIYDARIKLDAKLSSVIKDWDWCWLPARSEDLVSIQSSLSFVKFGLKDTPLWLPSKNLKSLLVKKFGKLESKIA